MNYKITVEIEFDDDNKYTSYDSIYMQIVESDGSIVNAVAETVLIHNSVQEVPPVQVEGVIADNNLGRTQ